MLNPARLRCEYRERPLGIDEPRPRFSWTLEGEGRGRHQVGYRIRVATDANHLQRGEAGVWDTGGVSSRQSALVEYGGPVLEPSTRYFWLVEVVDDSGERGLSGIEWFETGMLGSDWGEAEWITLPRPESVSDDYRPCPYLTKRFGVEGEIGEARAFVTALGVYRLFINGERVGKGHLTPGWTDYRKRLHYQVFDVTRHLVPGENSVTLVIADGWYSGYLGTAGERELYGREPRALLRLTLEGEPVVVTDATWEGAFGPHLASDIYRGESVDRNLASAEPGAQPAIVCPKYEGLLIAAPIEPIRPDREFHPVSVRASGENRLILDFGQNMAGWTRLAVEGASEGAGLTVRHAEMLDGDSLYVENLRKASATDSYITSSGDQILEPWFSYHGFRYAEIEHWGIDQARVTTTAVSARTPVEITGEFSCSNSELNKLHEAILWSYRSNWLEVPTDCPNRDERLGWTGDATICANTACYLMDAGAFYSKWMQDVEDAKTEDGLFTDVAPAVPPWTTRGAPGWGDGGVVVPWMLHRFYGDRRILERHLPSMRRWVDAIWAANLDLLWTREVGNNYGDWLEVGSYTIKEVISTCLFARSARMIAESFAALGDLETATTYSDLFDAIGKEFRRAYAKDGRIVGDTQTTYVLAIACGVLDEPTSTSAAARLVELIRENEGRLTTGFLATEHLLPVLADHGFLDEAYRLLEAHHFPSWLHFVDNGATTMWEHWDSWTPERGFKNPFMNSFNHCSLGSVAKFLYEYVGGLKPLEPGFRRFEIKPRPGGSLTTARVRYQSIVGEIVSEWDLTGQRFTLKATVPANTEATVVLPKGAVMESGGPVEKAEGLLSIEVSGEQAFLVLGGGAYLFEAAV